MKNGTDSQTPSLQDRMQQLGALAGFIVDFLATILSHEQVKYWLDHKTELKKKLREVFSIVDEYATVREEWQKFYKEFLGWDVDFSRTIIPTMPSVGKYRLIGIAKGLTLNKAFNNLTFNKSKYADDLDKAVPTNVRITSETYFVWVLDSIEPDQAFLGKTTNQADPNMKIGMTLLERIILEAKYFSETGKHLDIKGITLCSGSRYSGGDVPGAGWGGDGFRVGWSGLDFSDSSGGIRSAVAL